MKTMLRRSMASPPRRMAVWTCISGRYWTRASMMSRERLRADMGMYEVRFGRYDVGFGV